MSDAEIYMLGMIVGVVLGWCLHGMILQLAYKLKIVEYKGIAK